MAIACWGVSHRTAAVAVRERLAYDRGEVAAAASAAARLRSVREAVLVSTCNRTEVYVVCADGVRGAAAVAAHLARTRRIAPRRLARAAYRLAGPRVVRHLLEVAGGLDSQVVGEPQILGQLRAAHEAAMRVGATGPVLNGLFNRALAAGKRVRAETEIGRLPASVASVAVDLAGRVFGDLSGRTVLLLGTGETAELVAENLADAGPARLLVASVRDLDRARVLAARHGGEALPFRAALDRLVEVDVVVAATATAEPVVRRADVDRALSASRRGALFLVDLGLPRNVEPACGEAADVFLYDLDDLKAVATENLARRERWIGPARSIIEAAAAEIAGWLESLEAVPVIRELQAYGEACRREVWARAGRRVKELPPETRQEVEYLTRAVVAKLLHRPLTALKALSAGVNGRRPAGVTRYADLLRRLFGIG